MLFARHAVLALGALTLITLAPGSASATSYNFNVLYQGGNTASLAAGSDNPLTTTMQAGDSFTYSLTAQPGKGWRVVNSSGASFFPALSLQESGVRSGDYVLNLFSGGASVFTEAQNGVFDCCVHLGPGFVNFPAGLQFDKLSYTFSITSADTGSTPSSLLPFSGAPESAPDSFTYGAVSAVPLPGAVYLFGSALAGLMGFAGLRHKTASAQAA